jgi:acrylyl-CoA reductase (NADPH)
MAFKALVVKETTDGRFERTIVNNKEFEDLPPGDILIRVHYSSLNYKDALSATGNKGITRKYPHTPGIDASGIVEISRNENFAAGDEVVVTGHDLGMNTSGGYADYIRIPASWVIQKPLQYTLKDCMTIGTAGFTAALSLYKMELLGSRPEHGPIVVTGSTGGVGSMAVSILAKAGYEVIAITGKDNAHDYLRFLGATQVENRDFVRDTSGKNLLRTKWAGAIDTVGGDTLNTLLRACRPEGCVASTGMVDSPKLNGTVFPFILNGVSLVGVGSAETPMETRIIVWDKLQKDWNMQDKLTAIRKEVTLDELNEQYIDAILNGRILGRIVVSLV